MSFKCVSKAFAKRHVSGGQDIPRTCERSFGCKHIHILEA